MFKFYHHKIIDWLLIVVLRSAGIDYIELINIFHLFFSFYLLIFIFFFFSPGSNAPDECLKFIQQQFMNKKPSHKNVYMHVSCAINVDHMKKVLDNVLDMIVEINLRKCGNY